MIAWGLDMKKYLLGSAVIAALIGARSADAGEMQIPSAATPYNWTGWYVGATAGASWGQYHPNTSTAPLAAGVIDAAGAQTIKANGFVTGIEGGYNWQIAYVLLGVEADLQAVSLDGAVASGALGDPTAASGRFFVTSYGDTDWLFTARPRIGLIATNGWLFYATGGLALTRLQTDFSFVSFINTPQGLGQAAAESGKLDTLKSGYAAGAGFEMPLTNSLTVKADYLHVGFGNTAGVSTASILTPTFSGQVFNHSSALNADMVRVGLNYHLGNPAAPPSNGSILPLKMLPLKAQPPIFANWKLEAGARLWFSTGVTGAPNPFLSPPAPATFGSRLTFSDLHGLSGETFVRADHSSGFFIKGYLGAAGISNAKLNDEDSDPRDKAIEAYSNTLSDASGHIDYATIDAGYNFFRAANVKLGIFAGYNYYAQSLLPHGCSQLAGSIACVVPSFPSGLLGQAENDNYNSLRIGLSSEVTLANRLKLTTEAAYLPLVAFRGLDYHLPSQKFYFESSNSGSGVMLEAMLGYDVTDAWSVGIGARYWTWNMDTSGFNVVDLTTGQSGPVAGRFNAERYGMFAQTSYHWGASALPTDSDIIFSKAPSHAAGPVNWTGFYIGGSFGGGFSNDSWSDPFGSMPSGFGATNIAGFGDTIHATGPVGGGQIGVNWQTDKWVLGAQLDAGMANLRGDNTCFSGLGGVNCQRIVNSIGSITGRTGYAWDRLLAYGRGGAAWTATSHNLVGNNDDTGGPVHGAASAGADIWGWTVGGGLEYALTNHWSSFAEYDHIGMASASLTFPTIRCVNTAICPNNTAVGVKQSLDLFKLGVNYKI